MADVSGHGVPAAVLMAITHSLTKTYTGKSVAPRIAAFLFEQASGNALYPFVRNFCDGILRNLRSGSRHADLCQRRSSSSPAYSLFRWNPAWSGRQTTSSVGDTGEEVYPEEVLTLVLGDQADLLYGRDHRSNQRSERALWHGSAGPDFVVVSDGSRSTGPRSWRTSSGLQTVLLLPMIGRCL